MKERCAVPFVPQVKPGRESEEAAKVLSDMMARWQADGWEFSHLEDVTTVRNNGCLSSLAGNPTSTLSFQVAILVRDRG